MTGVLGRLSGPRGLAAQISCLVALVLLAMSSGVAEANPRYAAIVYDVNSGQVLFSRNADAQRYPASITKVMTLYLVFEELEAGRLSLDSQLRVSQRAANEVPSKVGVRPGSTISVRDAIGVLITRSANDVATVVAENIGGSVEGFAERMTRTARAIGMSNTTSATRMACPIPVR
jgi:D-alanyl-D-alanine carboxypeptidase